MPLKCIFKAFGEVKMFISWWRLPDILTRNKLLFYLSEDIYTTEQTGQIGNIKVAGYYENKPTLWWYRARDLLDNKFRWPKPELDSKTNLIKTNTWFAKIIKSSFLRSLTDIVPLFAKISPCAKKSWLHSMN